MMPGRDGAIQNFMGDLMRAAMASTGFILELGCGVGTGSTMAFSQGLMETIDPLMISVDWEDRLLFRPSVPWWHLVIGDDRDLKTYFAVKEIAGKRTPSIIFIDTHHDYDQMSDELLKWSPLASDKTVWLFHDTYMLGPRNEPMIRAITEFAAANNWRYDDFKPEPHGLGRMRR